MNICDCFGLLIFLLLAVLVIYHIIKTKFIHFHLLLGTNKQKYRTTWLIATIQILWYCFIWLIELPSSGSYVEDRPVVNQRKNVKRQKMFYFSFTFYCLYFTVIIFPIKFNPHGTTSYELAINYEKSYCFLANSWLLRWDWGSFQMKLLNLRETMKVSPPNASVIEC